MGYITVDTERFILKLKRLYLRKKVGLILFLASLSDRVTVFMHKWQDKSIVFYWRSESRNYRRWQSLLLCGRPRRSHYESCPSVSVRLSRTGS